jgi:hypothetical protein
VFNQELAKKLDQLEARIARKRAAHDEAIAAILSAIRAAGRVLENSKLSEMFGIEMADAEIEAGVDVSAPRRARRTALRKAARKTTRSANGKAGSVKRAARRT